MFRGLSVLTFAVQKDPYGVAFDGTGIRLTNAGSTSVIKLHAGDGPTGSSGLARAAELRHPGSRSIGTLNQINLRKNTMKQFATRLAQASGVVVLATTLVLVNTGTASAAPPPPAVPVSIVNTPLPVQGSVTANVTGTVAVSSLPPVALNTTPTTPLFVDADRPARNGFNATCFTGNIDPVNGQAACTLLAVPAGRQVVIETISCQAELYANEGPGDVQLIVPNPPLGGGAPVNVSHLLALTKQASTSSLDIWRMTTPLRAYASAPAQGSVNVGVFFRANPASPNPQGLSCTVSGYMVGQ